jgi:hypothetical protein
MPATSSAHRNGAHDHRSPVDSRKKHGAPTTDRPQRHERPQRDDRPGKDGGRNGKPIRPQPYDGANAPVETTPANGAGAPVGTNAPHNAAAPNSGAGKKPYVRRRKGGRGKQG